MSNVVEQVVTLLEEGRITRRQAVAGLTTLLAAALGAPRLPASEAPARSTFRSVGLNHVALRVTDLDRSVAFYRKHLGLRPLSQGPYNAFLSCGGNHFLALFRADKARLDHFCFTVPDYDASKTVERLKAAGLTPERQEDRVYFEDPDGITLQLTGEWSDYPGGRPDPPGDVP